MYKKDEFKNNHLLSGVYIKLKMATAWDQEDLFECSICLNYMLDRNPRSLLCLHTFCEDCLKHLANNNKIKCPTCREITELKKNDIQELKVNFHLLKIKDMGAKPQGSPKENTKSESPCQVCGMKPPSFTCNQCIKLMCESCKADHDDMFEDHVVFEMCQKHEEGITHLCTKCVIPLCMKCAVLDHKAHKAYFIDYTKGTQELKKEINGLYSNIKEEIEKIGSHQEGMKLSYEISLDFEKNLSAKRQYHMEQLDEIDRQTDALEKSYEEYERLQTACTETKDQCSIRAASLKALSTDSPGFCRKYSQLRLKAQEVLEDAKKLNVKYSIPSFVPCESKKPMVTEPKPGILRKEKIVLDVPNSGNISCTLQMALIEDDILLITYTRPYHVIRLNGQGMVVARHYPETKEYIRGVNVCDNRIYITQKKIVTVLSKRYKENTVIYKPDVDQLEIDRILVVDKLTIIVSGYYCGCIYKYNTETNKTEVMVKGLSKGAFKYMSVMYTSLGPRYILSECGTHRIIFYDQNWKPLKMIGGQKGSGEGEFYSPMATAVTENGLLVADFGNFRISHYSLEGQFLGHVITKQDGLNYQPRGIAYRYPYLWVCGDGHPVKCYQVKYK